MLKETNKKSLSEIVSYVLLIAMTIAIAVVVYKILMTWTNINPPINCEEGTSIILNSFENRGTAFVINLENNGRFNISGIILSVATNISYTPRDNLVSAGGIKGNIYYHFDKPLRPQESKNATFLNEYKNSSNLDLSTIKKVKIQAFILHNKRTRVLCTNSIIEQNI
jgi:flagellin-like protein